MSVSCGLWLALHRETQWLLLAFSYLHDLPTMALLRVVHWVGGEGGKGWGGRG